METFWKLDYEREQCESFLDARALAPIKETLVQGQRK